MDTLEYLTQHMRSRAHAYDTYAELLRRGLSEAYDAEVRLRMDRLWWEMTPEERRARTPHVPPTREEG